MVRFYTVRRFSALAAAMMLLALTLITPAMAQSGSEQNDRSIFFGKVTQIDGDLVTVAIGNVEMPQMPDQSSAGGQDGTQNTAPPVQNDGQRRGGSNFLENMTLTGELVTVQITDTVALTKQGARPEGQGADGTYGGNAQQNGKQSQPPNQDNQPQGTLPADGANGRVRGQGGFGMFGGGEEAVLSDLSVGDVVMLTYQTSTQALLAVHIFAAAENTGN